MAREPRSAALERIRRSPITAGACRLSAAAFALWAVVRLAGLERGYPGVALISYTPYVAALALAAAAPILALGRRWEALAAALAAAALIAVVLPRALAADPPDPRPTGPELRVLAVNLLVGSADVEPIARLVERERIDLVSFAELTPEAASAISASAIGDRLSHEVSLPQSGPNGTGLWSRFPLRRLPAPGTTGTDLPTIRAIVRLAGGVRVEAFSIHPVPPVDATSTTQNLRYLQALPDADPAGPPRLLIGDFNATLDEARLRDLLDRGYVDAGDALGRGLGPTWPQGKLWPLPVTIDHVLVDSRVEVSDYGTDPLSGTDHRAVRATLRLPGLPDRD